MNQKQQPPIKITLEENLVVITFGVEHAHYLFWETEQLLGRFGDHKDRVKMKVKEFMDFLQEESETPRAMSGSVEQMIERTEKAWAKLLIALEEKLGESYRQLEEIARKGGKEKNRFAEELVAELTEEARKIVCQIYEEIANEAE